MSQSGNSDNLWLFSLPLKHREIHEQRPEVIFQDRQILFTYLREKLVTAGDVCYLFPTDLPEFKVKTSKFQRYLLCFRLELLIQWSL